MEIQSVSTACERQTVGCHSESRSSVGPSLSLSLSLVLRFVYISIPTVYLAWSRSADLYMDLLPRTALTLGRYICPFRLCICGHGSLYASSLSISLFPGPLYRAARLYVVNRHLAIPTQFLVLDCRFQMADLPNVWTNGNQALIGGFFSTPLLTDLDTTNENCHYWIWGRLGGSNTRIQVQRQF